MDVPAGVTQEESQTGFPIHLPSAVLALIFLARRILPFLSLVDVGHFILFFIFYFIVRKNPSYRDSNSRPNVSEGFEVTLTIWATGNSHSLALLSHNSVTLYVILGLGSD